MFVGSFDVKGIGRVGRIGLVQVWPRIRKLPCDRSTDEMQGGRPCGRPTACRAVDRPLTKKLVFAASTSVDRPGLHRSTDGSAISRLTLYFLSLLTVSLNVGLGRYFHLLLGFRALLDLDD